jgi:predicted RNA binding protein YcfA (HicA-like mRNA interferase family)
MDDSVSSIKVKNIESALGKKGFHMVRQNKHRLWTFYVNGKKTSVRTFFSHGLSEYSDTLLSPIAKQMHLSRDNLNLFIECSLSLEEYQTILEQEGYIRE